MRKFATALEQMQPSSTDGDPYIAHYGGWKDEKESHGAGVPECTSSSTFATCMSQSSQVERGERPQISKHPVNPIPLFMKQKINISHRNILCMSTRNDEIVTGSADHGLKVVKIKGTKETMCVSRTLYSKKSGHTEWVTAVTHLTDDRIVSGGMDSKICLWRGVQCKDYLGHVGSISRLRPISGDPNQGAPVLLVSSSYDRSLKIWDLGRMSGPIASMHAHKGAVIDFVFVNGNIVSGGRDGMICVWDTSGAKLVNKLERHDNAVTCTVPTENDNNTFASGDMDGFLGVWDTRQRAPVMWERVATPGAALTLVESAGDEILAVGADNSVTVIDTRATSRLRWKETHTNFIYSMKVDTANSTVLLGTGNGRLIERQLFDGSCVTDIKIDENAIRCIDIVNSRIIAATDDGNLVCL
jgi:F-box/WD-40 domain protein 7